MSMVLYGRLINYVYIQKGTTNLHYVSQIFSVSSLFRFISYLVSFCSRVFQSF